MIVRRFFEPQLAQASYLIGCAASAQAIVIDPNRDADAYIAAAAADHLEITHVTETHIHADYLSGSRELAQRTGATLLLSHEGGSEWQYGFASAATLIRGGDRITLGKVTLDVVHTPGHTPEHLTFVITDGAVADAPIAAATGDFIFVGDVGRPALIGLDRIAGSFAPGALAHALAGREIGRIPQIDPTQLARMRDTLAPIVIDVRHESEWAGGHLRGAVHIPLGRLPDRLSELPPGQPYITQCQAGARSAIAASLLRRAGFADVGSLVGGFAAWERAGLPVER